MSQAICLLIVSLLIAAFGPEECHLRPLERSEEPKTDMYESLETDVSFLRTSTELLAFLDNTTERSSTEATTNASVGNTCEVYADMMSFNSARDLFKRSFLPVDSTDRIMYIDVKFLNADLSHLTSNDRNKIEEWQWVLQKNFFFMQYPVDLDVVTYNIIAPTYTENYVSVTVNSPEFCKDTLDLTRKVQELLWEELFQNNTNSYLCNRNVENDVTQKKIIYYLTMAWIGYDLDCTFFLDRTKQTSIKAQASVWLVIICFIIALYYPMLFKIVEFRAIEEKLSSYEQGKDNLDFLRRYAPNDVPFGFHRFILKTFYMYPFCNYKGLNRIRATAYLRLSMLFLILLSLTSIYRFKRYEHDSFKKYNDVYRVGFPFECIRKNTVHNILIYFFSLFIGTVILFIVVISMSKSTEMDCTCLLELQDNDEFICKKMKAHDESYNFTARFIEKFMSVISLKYWDSVCSLCVCKCQTLKKIMSCICCPFIRLPLLVDIPSSFCPFIWLILKGTCILVFKKDKALNNPLTIFYQSHIPTEIWWGKVILKFVRAICLLLWVVIFFAFVFLLTWSQWVILAACINFIRTFVYIIFVAFSSSVHLLRILIICVTTMGYLGTFYVEFLAKYRSILKKIFKIKHDLKSKNNAMHSVDDTFVSEDTFDDVIDAFFHIREGVFWVIFKTFLCLCFFIASTIVLFKNKAIDDTNSDNIIKLAFVVLTPKILSDCFERKGYDIDYIMDNNKSKIEKIIEKTHTKSPTDSKCKAFFLCCFCCFCCPCTRDSHDNGRAGQDKDEPTQSNDNGRAGQDKDEPAQSNDNGRAGQDKNEPAQSNDNGEAGQDKDEPAQNNDNGRAGQDKDEPAQSNDNGEAGQDKDEPAQSNDNGRAGQDKDEPTQSNDNGRAGQDKDEPAQSNDNGRAGQDKDEPAQSSDNGKADRSLEKEETGKGQDKDEAAQSNDNDDASYSSDQAEIKQQLSSFDKESTAPTSRKFNTEMTKF